MYTPEMIVRELQQVVDRYGILAVKHTLSFLESFPAMTLPVEIKNIAGDSLFLTNRQFTELKRTYGLTAPYNKIQAIKLLREMTSIGLKEAKDAIESIEDKLRM